MNSSEEQGMCERDKRNKRVSSATVARLAYQSLGVVYGDLSTSPLYVYKTTFSGKLSLHEDDDEIFGVFSFIFWTFTLIALFKYVFIVISANDHGEGGVFALYSLLCHHARVSVLPNQEALDEKLSAYATDDESTRDTWHSRHLRQIFEKSPKLCEALLDFVLLGASMTIGDGVLTPAISVLSAVSGIQLKITELHDNYVVIISCVILVALFSLQHHGTHRVAFMFAPVVTAWLCCISGIGVYNIWRWNPRIFRALSPLYMLKFLCATGLEGWVSLSGVVLSMTGVEAMFANLGHFSPLSIKIAFTVLVYPALMLAYMGEAAFLSKHRDDIQRNFYKAIPEAVFWPVFIVATMAAVVGSQAAISATFSIVRQCSALNCFPRVKVVHTSAQIFGQVYIPEINWMLMCLCLALTIGLRDTNMMGHAYGLAITSVMLVTTCLMALVMTLVWNKNPILSLTFHIFFGSIELLYVSSCFNKIPEGGFVPVILSLLFTAAMYTWHYGTLKKHEFEVENQVSIDRIVSLGPGLGMIRVPGIGLVYTNLDEGVPAVFGHFVANLPAFHAVLVLLCVTCVHAPRVRDEDRLVVSRVGPRDQGVFRCVLRYGYKDLPRDSVDFEARLVEEIVRFVEADHDRDCNDSKEEYVGVLRAKETGVAYIVGHCYAESKRSSSVVKRIAIDVVYKFLSKNCRGNDVALNVPHTSMLEVGMVYYV